MPETRPERPRETSEASGQDHVVSTVHTEIVPFYPRKDRPNLFCFHDGHFDAISKAMSDAWSVQGMRVNNLDDADFGLTIEHIAHEHCRDLVTFQPEGGYALIGYSFGGLVAFEVARILLERGLTVSLLALCDTPNSQFRRNLTPEEAVQVHRAYLTDRKRKYVDNLKRARLDLLTLDLFHYARRKASPLWWRVVKAWNQVTGSATRVSHELRADAMWNAYIPGEYRGNLLLLRAQGRDAEFGDDITMGWRKVVCGGVDVRYVSCDHAQMKSPRYAGELAQEFELGVRALNGR